MRHRFQVIKSIIALSSLTLTIGCRGIPNDFQGEYRAHDSGVSLELSNFDGVIKFSDGRKISEDVRVLEFDEIAKGQSGIFAREHSRNNELIEIFVVRPSGFQDIDGADFTWAEAEVLYAIIDQKDFSRSNEITLKHCEAGQVLIDKRERRFEIGCPPSEKTYRLKKERDYYTSPGGGELIHP